MNEFLKKLDLWDPVFVVLVFAIWPVTFGLDADGVVDDHGGCVWVVAVADKKGVVLFGIDEVFLRHF